MTTKEMEDEARSHRDCIDWTGAELTSAANLVCAALWLIAAEVCDRLDNINGSVNYPEHR